MPLFEYKCAQCGLVEEHLVFSTRETPTTQTCGRCRGVSTKLDFPTRISLARSGMDNAPTDNLIGGDADRRWADIRRRQELRDTVRKESGEVGVSMVGRNRFQPVTSTQKELRTSLNEAIASSDVPIPSEPVPGRPKT